MVTSRQNKQIVRFRGLLTWQNDETGSVRASLENVARSFVFVQRGGGGGAARVYGQVEKSGSKRRVFSDRPYARLRFKFHGNTFFPFHTCQ